LWKNKSVSVILPTYNEKDSIRQVISDFFDTGYVDEVIVVNNNAVQGTEEEVAKTKAIQIFEEKQGYGHAIQRGFKEASGDLLVISEPDGTFLGKDIVKLLAYSEDFDAVFGTRTTSIMIWQGANMRHILRAGNIFVAKLIEFFFNTTQLTDVGCTYKLISRKVYERIKDKFTIGGSHFGPELMLLVITNGFRFIEVPVNYCRRVGKSSVTGNKIIAFSLGLRMIDLIIRYRISSLFKKIDL